MYQLLILFTLGENIVNNTMLEIVNFCGWECFHVTSLILFYEIIARLYEILLFVMLEMS